MGLRETMNRNPAVMSSAMIGLIVVTLAAVVWHTGSGRSPGEAAKQAFFTVDDGETWFADDIDKIPPFDHSGKSAVRAYLFQCGGDKPFIAYLHRFTPEGRKAIEDARAKAKATNTAPPDSIFLSMMARTAGEAKKAKDAGKWVSATKDPGLHANVTQLACPGGDLSSLQPFMP